MLFRRRSKRTPAVVGAPALAAPEENARELMLSVMRAAPDVRYRAARALGLMDGLDGAAGADLERRLLERARDARALAALDEALAR
jgi:hypothetical protein